MAALRRKDPTPENGEAYAPPTLLPPNEFVLQDVRRLNARRATAIGIP